MRNTKELSTLLVVVRNVRGGTHSPLTNTTLLTRPSFLMEALSTITAGPQMAVTMADHGVTQQTVPLEYSTVTSPIVVCLINNILIKLEKMFLR